MTFLPSHPSGWGERLPTRNIACTASSYEFKPNPEPGHISIELAATHALIASSKKDTISQLQTRVKHLEAAAHQKAPCQQPRDSRGCFVATTASVPKTLLASNFESNGGRARRRTQTELLMEAAVKYVDDANVSIVSGEPLVEGAMEGYAHGQTRRDVEEE